MARGATDRCLTVLRGDGRAFLFYITHSRELRHHPFDRSQEYIHVVSKERPKSSKPRIHDLLTAARVLVKVGFLQPYSLGT